ncbi:MAG: response regulator [Candidatus Micrarchaeota archaeon]|nr:response regulator [Candidatus Micrarchaeota archaeon]
MEIDDLRLEQDIVSFLKARDKAMETNEILKEFSNVPAEEVKGALVRLKTKNKLEARNIGKFDFWYVLESVKPKKILIIEDDKDINNLIRLSLGEENYEIKSAYDGDEGLKEINIFKPDLVILDLMLPGTDGLEICKKIKLNAETKNIIVVIVSAADATVNRFFGIQYGADYYIKKPFDPMELRALVNIFLNKSGELFDPLVDLPDVERLVNNLKIYLNEENSKFVKLEIEGIAEYEKVYGEKAKMKLVRLISQMTQDKIADFNEKIFISYLGDSSFVLVSESDVIYTLLSELEAEFRRVNQFIKQKQLSKSLYQKLESTKIENDHPIRLVYYDINIDAFKKQFEQTIIKDYSEEAIKANIAAVRNYSLDQIRACFENSKNVDITIKEVGGTLRITAGKEGKR